MMFEYFRGYALRVVFRYIYRYEKAIDITHDGFLKLFSRIEKFETSENETDEAITRQLAGYLRRIMINTAIDELRKGNMLPEIGGIPDHVWDFTEKDHNADQLLLYKDLIVMIKELPPQYRTVFNMYVIDGYNHIEIASMLNIPVGTSKSNLHKARTLLREHIKKLEQIKVCSI